MANIRRARPKGEKSRLAGESLARETKAPRVAGCAGKPFPQQGRMGDVGLRQLLGATLPAARSCQQ